jgi:hypothetical protein
LAWFLILPEHLSRAFAQLGDVEVSGQRVTIKDKARLQRFARPRPFIDDPCS